jgi:hypothetical protein
MGGIPAKIATNRTISLVTEPEFALTLDSAHEISISRPWQQSSTAAPSFSHGPRLSDAGKSCFQQ